MRKFIDKTYKQEAPQVPGGGGGGGERFYLRSKMRACKRLQPICRGTNFILIRRWLLLPLQSLREPVF